jgi:pimeloyl-ACP methyl ester carboxylesterase
MHPSRSFPRSVILLALLLGMLACNLPLETRYDNSSNTARPTPPVRPTQPVVGATTTLLQPEPSSPTPLIPTVTPAPAYRPVFEPSGCAFAIPAGANPQCGYLLVPENRARPGSPTIRLAVAIFPSRSASPAPDPVIYLSGGPGSSALELAGYMFRQGLDPLLETRDLIFFDQRGTGYSEPVLDCPERQQEAGRLLAGGLSASEKEQVIVDAFQRCRDRLSAGGIDLTAYTSAAIAADVDDLRRALGYAQVNLYGVSYGTRLALTVMRDFPRLVRSVVLDSTLPPQVNLYTSLAPNAERAFDVLFDRCAANASCGAAYPDLKTVFYDLVDRLNADPLPVIVRSGGVDFEVLVDGGLLVDVLFVGLYNPPVIATMPQMIYNMNQGDPSILQERLGLYFDPSTALGMQMSVICAEELPFGSPEEAFSLAEGLQPQIAGFFPGSIQPLFAVCQMWGAAAPDPRENQAVSSDIPTLILAGEFDPVTPPDWGRMAAASLTRSYFYEFPANGHWVTRSSPCALSMMFAFLEDPGQAPRDGCITEIGELDFQR